MLDLSRFLAEHEPEHLHVRRPVALEAVGALTAQATETVVFHDIEGYPGWRLVDLLFADRTAQARVLGCSTGEVLPRLVEVLREGPRRCARWTTHPATTVS